MTHRYGDPCRTCGKPAYDYNVATCADCQREAEHQGTSPLQRYLMPGLADVLKGIREHNQQDT